MSIHIYSVLLLASILLIYVNSADPIKSYSIRKDFFKGFKAGEFSIRDTSGKHLYYRIESNYAKLHSLKIIAYPSKQEVGRLKAVEKLLVYKAEISILDPRTNQWVLGLIEKNFQLFGSLFKINWNGNHLKMENDIGLFTTKFLDKNGQLLAQFRLQNSSVFWTKKYDMQIFSTKYPEQIYLLGLAAHDHTSSGKRHG
ncbi:unnamed protein product [Rotaria sordida]|uniref:Uncharacterized protein n=2 Tax=Rotaria sordida TaxID=392033 RepID=A0A814I8C5_9BILA|nr:unnamed protein product [Rotaria sordida]CAF0961695.1 unnamed protein product [Rotaria sordida]CAF0988975.1 unnamed protein product [Rotaria sordida]CAF1020503.1 unnamed protein product [Rotaria sordida]CAF3693088.1 unnamed protein product [Rotaria sordida]